MKKNVFYYLFAVICSVTLFASCSDDDEDTTWQQIPEITSDNVTLKLNNQALSGATASLDIINAESAKVTLKNAVYGHPTVNVDVTMVKYDETSYQFSGEADLEAARTSLVAVPLKVAVKGMVATSGKMTVDVTTSGWASVSGVYANDSLALTLDGNAHGNSDEYAVTLIAKEDGKAALTFKKIVNVGLNVEADVELVDGTISGTMEPMLGYTIAVSGTVKDGRLALDMVSSGYGTLKGSYSATKNQINFNGKDLTSGAVAIDITAEYVAQVTLGGMLVGSRSAVLENVAITQEEGKEVYHLNGKAENNDYVVTFEGTVDENRSLTAKATYTVVGDIVGKWNIMKTPEGMAAPIFNFATTKGSVTFPESLLNIIPENMKPMFPATMPDAQLVQLMQGLLGTYAVYLQSVEFTPQGRLIATYVDMPKDTNGDGKIDAQDTNDMTPKTFALLQYYMKEGELYLAVDLMDLLSLMPSAASARAWEPGNVLTEGFPVAYQVNGNVLSVSVKTNVIVGLAGVANGLLPMIGMMLPDDMKPVFETVGVILGGIVEGVLPDVKQLEVGLNFTK